MTKEEILSMKAGFKLDMLVAEEVFNQQPSFIEQYQVVIVRLSDGSRTFCDRYSTDISAAWVVVDKLRKMKDSKGNQLLCCLKMHCDVPGEAWDIHWSYSELSVMDDGHEDHKLPLSWFSFPEAVCKAALLIKLEVR